MKYWLIVYAKRSGRLLRCKEFSDGQEALRRRFTAERVYAGNPDLEIVVLGADSLDALKVTHSRYFARGVPVTTDPEAGE